MSLLKTNGHSMHRTMRAVLMCSKCRKPQLHTFFGLQAVDNASGIGETQQVIYECSNCSTRRMWGLESAW